MFHQLSIIGSLLLIHTIKTVIVPQKFHYRKTIELQSNQFNQYITKHIYTNHTHQSYCWATYKRAGDVIHFKNYCSDEECYIVLYNCIVCRICNIERDFFFSKQREIKRYTKCSCNIMSSDQQLFILHILVNNKPIVNIFV